MSFRLFLPVLLAATACPPAAPPAPPSPDASDAAPAPVPTPPTPPQPSTPCQAACDAMAAICGPQPADCVTVMAGIDGRRLIRMPDGGALTCAAIASAKTKADLAAVGAGCP